MTTQQKYWHGSTLTHCILCRHVHEDHETQVKRIKRKEVVKRVCLGCHNGGPCKEKKVF